MSHRETLKIVLADLAREAAGPADRHPSDNDLVAYEAGELTGGDHRRVQDHLVGCEDCARLVLELAALEPKALAGEDTVSEFEIEQSLRRTRARIPPTSHESIPAPAVHRSTPDRSSDSAHPRLAGSVAIPYRALAAGLAVAVLGLASWVAVLHSRGGGPEINYLVRSVRDTSTRGGADQAEVAEVPAGSNAVLLVLHVSMLGDQGGGSYADFRVEITGAGRTWSRDGLLHQGFGSFTVTLRREEFPAGSYTVRILGSRNGQQELLAEYALQLRYS